MSKPIVAISRAAAGADAVFAAVQSAVEQACEFAELVRPGATVLLKPNVFAPQPPPATTSPQVVAAVARLCRQAGAARVIVAEGRSISTAKYRPDHNTTLACFEATGMAQAVAQAGAEALALEQDEFCEVALPEGELLRRALVPITLLEADVVINLPALKIHSLTLATLAIKNFHGVVSDPDKLFSHCYREARLARKLVDIVTLRKPDLNIVSGLTGLEGDHAMPPGRPVEMGIIIAGQDIVAVDAVAGAAMGLAPEEVDTTRIAHQRGLGEGQLENIEIRGASLEQVRKPFARPDTQINDEKFPGLRLFAGDYCRACEYYICRGLEAMQAQGRLSEQHPLNLVIGRNPPAPARLEGKTILVGDCCLASASVKPLRDNLLLEGRLAYLWACPPMEFRLRAAELLG